MEDMTLEEKVGQLFVVNLEQLDASKGDYYEHQKITKAMKESLSKYPVGGVILFSRNIHKRKQTKELIRKLQKNSKTSLFVSVDEEGGDVARVGNNPDMKTTSFPTMEEIGSTQDGDYVYEMASTIGEQIGELGFNVDFAPVADVKTSELNQEIGSRSFGDDPEKVAKFVSAYVKGLESKDICATLKHFPGQGSASGDTHQGSVDIDSSIASLRKTDFVPFESGIEAGADFIMVSHISVSKVTETSEPASMSKLVMTTILREELDYKGLIITDAFDMASITKYYSAGEAATGAFEAGADIILMPQDLPEAYNAILDKVKSGDISEKRLNDTVQRILQLKYQKGIMSLTDTTKVSNSP
jgi:beta-N-acetylhexosaminidase